MTAGPVYVALEDAALRDTLAAVLADCGPYRVSGFEGGRDWLSMAPTLTPGCALLDLDGAPGEGVEVVERMIRDDIAHVAVMLCGSGDVAAAAHAMRAGAADILAKPAMAVTLAPALSIAFARLRVDQARRSRRAEARSVVARLSAREQDVMRGMVEGLSNKLIAQRLGVSPRTIEAHRASLFAKTGLSGLAELVRCALAADLLDR